MHDHPPNMIERHPIPLRADTVLTLLARQRSRMILIALTGNRRTLIELRFLLGMREAALRRELRRLTRAGFVIRTGRRKPIYERSRSIRIARIGSLTRIHFFASDGGELRIESNLSEGT